MRVLITGGAGFIGSHIVRSLLNTQIDLAVFDNLSTGSAANLPESALIRKGDIRDFAQVQAVFREFLPTHVIHAAGDLSGRLATWPLVQRSLEHNLTGTLNVAKAMLDLGTKRLVYISTAGVYGEVPEKESASESYPLRPCNPYSASKASGELFLQTFEMLETVILRYANVYGPCPLGASSGAVIPTFIARLQAKQSVTVYGREFLGDGGCRRDYVFVDDVVAATLLALNHTPAGIFNVSRQESFTTMELLDIIADKVGWRPAVCYEAPRGGEIKSSAVDSSRLQLLGWNANIGLAKGIELTVDKI